MDGPETALWRAVIVQAIADASLQDSALFNARGTKESAFRTADLRRYRAEARRWLIHFGQDFRLICHMAGLEPGAVRDKALGMARMNWPAIPRQGRDKDDSR